VKQLLEKPYANVAMHEWVQHLGEASRIDVGITEGRFVRVAAFKDTVMKLAVRK
jgi:hypothetical protein